MKKLIKHCYCKECSRLDWIDNHWNGNLAWCKIETEEHRKPRSTIDDSFCKDWRKSTQTRY